MELVTLQQRKTDTFNETVCRWAVNNPTGAVNPTRIIVIRCKSLPPDTRITAWLAEHQVSDMIPKNMDVIGLVCHHDIINNAIKIICWTGWIQQDETWIKSMWHLDCTIPARFLLKDPGLYLNKYTGHLDTHPHFPDFSALTRLLHRVSLTKCPSCNNGIVSFCEKCYKRFLRIITEGSILLPESRHVSGELIVSTIRSLVLMFLQCQPSVAVTIAEKWRESLVSVETFQNVQNREYTLMVPLSLGRLILDYQNTTSMVGIQTNRNIFALGWALSSMTIMEGLYCSTRLHGSVLPWEIHATPESTAFVEIRDFLRSYHRLKELAGETLTRAVISYADQLLFPCTVIESTSRKKNTVGMFLSSSPSSSLSGVYDIEEAYFPPCMTRLLENYRQTHHLTNDHRFPLTSFLCSISPINNNEKLIEYWNKTVPPIHHKTLLQSHHFKVHAPTSSNKMLSHGRKVPLGCDNDYNKKWCPFKGDNRKEQCANHLKNAAGMASNSQVIIVNPPSYYRLLRNKKKGL